MPDLFNIQKTAVTKAHAECRDCAQAFEDSAALAVHKKATGHDSAVPTTKDATMPMMAGTNWEALLEGFVNTINDVVAACAGDGEVPAKVKAGLQAGVDWCRAQADAMIAAETADDIVKADDTDEEMPLAEALEVLTEELGEEGRALLVRGMATAMHKDLGGQTSLGDRVQRQMQGRN